MRDVKVDIIKITALTISSFSRLVEGKYEVTIMIRLIANEHVICLYISLRTIPSFILVF